MVTWVLFFSLFFSKQDVLSFSAPSLTVEVSNIKHKDKELRIAVCQKIHFLKDTPPFKFMLINTHNAIESATFVLPKGSYAISVFHDLNGNGKLDKNMFGAPKEPYGFSRNYKPFMRAPRFEEVVVEISEQDKKTSIQLIHP
jgi:uncharacterized protein (DUF2141 family)